MKIHIREIDHIVIRASDVEKMTRFYCDVLGCSVEKEQRDLGFTQLRAGRSLIGLLRRGGVQDAAYRARCKTSRLCATPWRGRLWAVAVSVRPRRKYGRTQGPA